jgi:hypothetical protein
MHLKTLVVSVAQWFNFRFAKYLGLGRGAGSNPHDYIFIIMRVQ